MKVIRHVFARSACGALVALAVMTAAIGPATAQGDKVMLIIDSSRSMWGQIDGVNKVVHARDALGQFFKRQQGEFRLGLMAYGHQEKASCEDFAVIKEIDTIDAEVYARTVENIAPKGSTPIAASLDAAAQAMARESGRKHIILLSDGLDNCGGDPCALAEQLSQSVPRMTFHAIAFDKAAEKAELEKLSCVAKPSGGVFHAAGNREQLDAALASVSSAITAPPQPAQPAAVPDNIDPAAPVPIKLTAYLAGNEERITRGLIWRVFAGRAGDDGRYQLLKEMRKPQPTLDLKPGSYFVNVSWGLAHTTKRVEVAPGRPAHEQLVLNAGAIRLNARQASGAPIDLDDATFNVYADETDQFGNRERIIADAEPGQAIRFNTGTYFVISQYGGSNAVVESRINVKPGQLSEVILIHDASRVTFRLAERPGGEAIADTLWTIKKADGAVVERSAGAFPTHILTAGRYKVEAEYNGRLFTRQFDLAGGGAQQIEVLMR